MGIFFFAPDPERPGALEKTEADDKEGVAALAAGTAAATSPPPAAVRKLRRSIPTLFPRLFIPSPRQEWHSGSTPTTRGIIRPGGRQTSNENHNRKPIIWNAR